MVVVVEEMGVVMSKDENVEAAYFAVTNSLNILLAENNKICFRINNFLMHDEDACIYHGISNGIELLKNCLAITSRNVDYINALIQNNSETIEKVCDEIDEIEDHDHE